MGNAGTDSFSRAIVAWRGSHGGGGGRCCTRGVAEAAVEVVLLAHIRRDRLQHAKESLAWDHIRLLGSVVDLFL